MSYIYIASPYWDEDPAVREDRYQANCYAVGYLAKHYLVAYSPIAHLHNAAKFAPVPEDKPLLLGHDLVFARKSASLLILGLPGWKTSLGLGEELSWFNIWRKPIVYTLVEATKHAKENFLTLKDELDRVLVLSRNIANEARFSEYTGRAELHLGRSPNHPFP